MLLRRLFAATYDRSAQRAEEAGLRDQRHALLDGLQGDVLEIGAGTGLNLDHYPEGVRLVLLEPDLYMSRKLEKRVSGSGRQAEIVAAPAEALPFANESFDAVVTTLVLCSVADLGAALAEINRVLRPGGQLLLFEHVRGEGRQGILQDAIAPASRLLVACSPNRRTAQAVREAGFELDEEPFQLLGGPLWIRPAFRGIAVKRST